MFPYEWPEVTGCLDPALANEEYYHGLLPREDIVDLLEQNGDFLIRTSILETSTSRELILSVMQDATGSVKDRHFPILRVGNAFVIENGTPFDSVVDLVRTFKSIGASITKRLHCPLIRPISRRPWLLLHEHIRPEKLLGNGAFGEVYSGYALLPNGDTPNVAIKFAKVETITKDQIKEFMTEARMMRSMNHPNIVRFYGVGAFKDPLLVVMELVDEGSLEKILIKKRTSPRKKVEYCTQAAWGIEYLHSINIMHRDIAARNCLVGGGTLKISDFGMSQKGTEYQLDEKKKVPIRWMSPEAITTMRYTPKSDVWAYGILCWEIYSDGALPYSDTAAGEIRDRIKSGNLLAFPPITPPQISKLIYQCCWDRDPVSRVSMAHVCNQLERWTHLPRPLPGMPADPPKDKTITRTIPTTSSGLKSSEAKTPSTGKLPDDLESKRTKDKESKKEKVSRRSNRQLKPTGRRAYPPKIKKAKNPHVQ